MGLGRKGGVRVAEALREKMDICILVKRSVSTGCFLG